MPFLISISLSLPAVQPLEDSTSTRKHTGGGGGGSRNTAGCTQAEEDLLQ